MKKLSTIKGLAMVEFTIMLPLLLFLLLTTIELGRAFYTYTELEKLSRDGARYLSSAMRAGTTGTSTLTQKFIDDTSNLTVYGSILGGTNALLPSLTTDQVNITLNGNYIEIEIVYPFQPVLTQIPDFFNNGAISLNFNMTSSYTMRVL